MGSKGDLLRTLAAASGVKAATRGVRSSVLKWRIARFLRGGGDSRGTGWLWRRAGVALRHPSIEAFSRYSTLAIHRTLFGAWSRALGLGRLVFGERSPGIDIQYRRLASDILGFLATSARDLWEMRARNGVIAH
jgi:hypothetical protein